jgi:hypothetical protein
MRLREDLGNRKGYNFALWIFSAAVLYEAQVSGKLKGEGAQRKGQGRDRSTTLRLGAGAPRDAQPPAAPPAAHVAAASKLGGIGAQHGVAGVQ